MSCDVSSVAHNLPADQTFVIPKVSLPTKVPTATQCKEPWLVELEPWTAAVDPHMLERVLSKFEADGRTGAFNPELGEKCMRAFGTAGAHTSRWRCIDRSRALRRSTRLALAP